jgi:replication factor A1
MNLNELRPGMENVNLSVRVLRLEEPRKVTTNSGFTHVLIEGKVEDETGMMDLTVWNEQIESLKNVEIGKTIDLRNCFITSFKGVLSVNVGRDSEIIQVKEKT